MNEINMRTVLITLESEGPQGLTTEEIRAVITELQAELEQRGENK